MDINRMIHERSRLLILTYLAGSDKTAVSFGELQNKLEMTSGNLSIQLKKLSLVEYIEIRKTFKDNKPYTTVSITERGAKALNDYLDEMESLIQAMRK